MQSSSLMSGRCRMPNRSTAYSRLPNRVASVLPRSISRDVSTTALERSNQSLAQIAASVGAAAVIAAAAPGNAFAEALYAAGPSQYNYPVAERYATQEEQRFDEYLLTKEVKELLSLLQKGNIKLADLEAARLKAGFQRGMDGRVSLKAQNNHWFSIKNDMQSPGFILARDQEDGRVFFLPPDDSGRLLQIDLSDDAVVGQLFSSGAWQDVLQPLQAEDMSGNIVPLILEDADFRNTASLLEDAMEEQE